MSFKKNPPPVRYTNAAFPPLDERICTTKAEPVPDVELLPGFGYTVAFACRMETFRGFVE